MLFFCIGIISALEFYIFCYQIKLYNFLLLTLNIEKNLCEVRNGITERKCFV